MPALDRPLRLVHLTDLHVRNRWWPAYDVITNRLAADPPDVICITGDFVDDKQDHTVALPILRRLLAGLRSRLGVFGVLGNHDGDLLRAELPGVTLLDPGVADVREDVQIVGLGGVGRRSASAAFLRELWPAPAVRVLLTHYPDTVKTHGTLGSRLVLAGHTHGGQVCLPTSRPLITHDALPRPFHAGLHPWPDPSGNAHLLVGRGLGCSTLRLRVFCPAEVWEVVLTP